LVADGVLRRSLTAVYVAAVLIAVARELTWLLGGLHISRSMKMQAKASQLLNAHLVVLTASIPTIEQHERLDYLKVLNWLRQQGSYSSSRKTNRLSRLLRKNFMRWP
jgi:hypothetical protein